MSAQTELIAAGITDPQLQADYLHCRDLAAGHGRTYFLATRLLPPRHRPAVHALYGFARTADEIVDDTVDDSGGRVGPVQMRERLDQLSDELAAGAAAAEPSCRAVADTARRYGIEPGLFEDFLTSMRMDLTVTEYETYADLEGYMHGSAAVIGLQMLPILGTIGARADAAPFAAHLGIAFQLTNFIRDVGEDLRRGRIYLPLESLRRHGVDRAHLERRIVDGPVRDLLRFEIDRARAIYRAAEPGIDQLQPRSRACVSTAFTLYRGILDEVERADYQVLDRRVSVPVRRRLPVALVGLGRTLAARARPTRTGSA